MIDFGLCADYTDHSRDSLLYDKSGTAGYIAPEILGLEIASRLYDKKVDIYSIGVILYEMITGFNPFKCKRYEDSLLKNYYSQFNYWILPDNFFLKKFLLGITAKTPNIRYSVDKCLSDDFLKKKRKVENPISTRKSNKYLIFP